MGDLGATLDMAIHPVAIWAHEETSLDAGYRRDEAVRSWAGAAGIPFHELPRNGVVRRLGGRTLQRVDEAAADTVLASFLTHRGHAYSGGMSSPVTAPTAASRLSVHLAWGTISLRRAFSEISRRMAELKGLDSRTSLGEDSTGAAITAGRWRKSLRAMESRLYWHDHFIQRLEDEPETEFHPINRAFGELTTDGFLPGPPEEYQRRLQAWLGGTTGYPMVDASIRALRTSGYLPFRMRAMIVSFAVHVLRLWWRDILYPMGQWMADYIPGIHLSQLQMQAALTGINTIRVYNPTKQLTDHDPDARFVRAAAQDVLDRHGSRKRGRGG